MQKVSLTLTDEAITFLAQVTTPRKRGEYVSTLLTEQKGPAGYMTLFGMIREMEGRLKGIEVKAVPQGAPQPAPVVDTFVADIWDLLDCAGSDDLWYAPGQTAYQRMLQLIEQYAPHLHQHYKENLPH